MMALRTAPAPASSANVAANRCEHSGLYAIPRLTVMVIEPDVAQRDALVAALSPLFRVVDCADALQAAEVLGTLPAPDLVVCTVALPQIDGCSFAVSLRARPAFSKVPFIFLTREKNVPEMLRALSAGGRQCLEKPVKMPQLVEKVGRILAWANGK